MNLRVTTECIKGVLGARIWLVSGMMCAGLLAGCAERQVMPEDESLTPAEVLLYAESPRNDEQGRIVLPVMLNDQGPFYFLLDTGATHSVLSRDAATRLALVANDNAMVAVRGVNGLRRAPTTMVDTLQAGSLVFHSVRMPVLTAAVLSDVDGILGMDNLGDMKVTADFNHDQVRISDSKGRLRTKPRSVVEFVTLSHRLIVVRAYIGGINVRAVVDTGGAHTLGNAALLRELLRQSGGRLKGFRTEIVDATDTVQPAMQVQVPRIRMGGTSIEKLPVAFGRFPVFDKWGINDQPALLVGMDALNLMSELTIDYRRKELQIVSAQ